MHTYQHTFSVAFLLTTCDACIHVHAHISAHLLRRLPAHYVRRMHTCACTHISTPSPSPSCSLRATHAYMCMHTYQHTFSVAFLLTPCDACIHVHAHISAHLLRRLPAHSLRRMHTC